MNDPDPKGIFSSSEYNEARRQAFSAPSKGETVLACKHFHREPIPIFVGQLKEGVPTGIGMWIKTENASEFWVRWICLCRWCNLWRKIRRWPPVRMAAVKATWEG